MWTKKDANTEAEIQRRIRAGRGQGSGADYIPWIVVHDKGTNSRVHQVWGFTSGRRHHLLSDGEWRLFPAYDWPDNIRDIREQYPLDRLETFRVALGAGIRHPMTRDGTPQVLTTDFLLTVGTGRERRLVARTYKPEDLLDEPRVLEKYEIERRYWLLNGVDWALVTKQEVDEVFAKNVEKVRAYFDLRGLWQPHPSAFSEVIALFFHMQHYEQRASLAQFCDDLARLAAVPMAIVVVAAKHLIATKRLVTDMSDPKPFLHRPLHCYELVKDYC